MNAREGAALEAWKSVVSKYPDVDELINRMSDEGRPANEIAQRLIEDGYSTEIVSAYCGRSEHLYTCRWRGTR